MSAIRVPALLVVMLSLTGGAPPASAHTAGDRSCGVFVESSRAQVGAVIRRGTPTCATTRRVLRWYLDSDTPSSGSARVRIHARWTCASAAAYAFPRLASCNRGRTIIAAYSTAD
jgi:hypothetical protein